MKKRMSAFVLTLVLSLSLLPLSASAEDSIAAKSTKDNGHPYYIMVNRKMSVVTVYGLDEHGYYTVPVRAMVCSAGAAKTMTPRVTSSIGRKHRWRLMMGGVYAQYASQFYNDCLFHSLCYSKASSSTMIRSTYNNIGAPASHGCVRLQTEDAKWIYENCDEGTIVTIYDGDSPGELGKPAKMADPLPAANYAGWDPTDPAGGNPWASKRTSSITLSSESLRLTPGQTVSLNVTRAPAGSRYPTVMFRSDNPSVAIVDGAGRIRSTGALGKATVTVTCGSVVRRCDVVVTNADLPFCDVTESAWFYGDVRYLYGKKLISGSENYTYAPETPVQYSEALQLFYNVAGKPTVAHSGAGARAWYADAMDWASDKGLAQNADADTPLTKQELVVLMFRYDMVHFPDAPASADGAIAVKAAAEAPDADQAAEAPDADDAAQSEPDENAAAVAWAFRIGLLQGDAEGALALDATITRAQTAALLHRYCLARQL